MKPVESLTPLGQHIRLYRKANRYTLGELSEVIGCSKSYLFELEHSAQANPTISTLAAIARATGTSLARVATLAAAIHMEPK